MWLFDTLVNARVVSGSEASIAGVHHQVKDVGSQLRLMSEVTCASQLIEHPELAARAVHQRGEEFGHGGGAHGGARADDLGREAGVGGAQGAAQQLAEEIADDRRPS